MKKGIIIGITIFLLFLTYLTSSFIKKEKDFNENIRLKQENQDLIAQIQKIRLFKSDNKTAKVFSTYPFNTKNQIVISAGKKNGAAEFSQVLMGENILVGRIIKVFDNYSVIQTIFDHDFRSPVRIGKEEIDGLLEGGNEPKITLIDKEKNIEIGSVVYSAGKDFDYGLKIGEIKEIKKSSLGSFNEASIKIPYNVNELREVMIK